MGQLGRGEVVLRCVGCGRTPSEIEEYSPESTGEGISAELYVWREEGTLNTSNGHFYCTSCYIAAEIPLGVAP